MTSNLRKTSILMGCVIFSRISLWIEVFYKSFPEATVIFLGDQLMLTDYEHKFQTNYLKCFYAKL